MIVRGMIFGILLGFLVGPMPWQFLAPFFIASCVVWFLIATWDKKERTHADV